MPEDPSSSSSVIPEQHAERPSSAGDSSEEEGFIKLVSLYNGHSIKVSRKVITVFQINVFIDIIRRTRDLISALRAVMPEDLDTIERTDNSRSRQIIDSFNKHASSIKKLWEGAVNGELGEWSMSTCTAQVAQTICSYSYECAVPHAKALNSHYAPFSSEVYGETRYEQMNKLITQLNLGPNDVFVDLGSGVGQIVLFTAAVAKVKKCVGIEIAQLPAACAAENDKKFKEFIGYFGKSHSPYELYKGDFLEDEYRDLITKEATVIFINNFAFQPDLESRIKQEVIAELQTGVRIVTTKRYASGNREMNERKMGDVEAILEVTQLESVEAPTSWTDKKVPYYLHTVNRAKMENFYFNSKSKKGSLKSSASSSREGSYSEVKKGDLREPKQEQKPSESAPSVKKEISVYSDYDDATTPRGATTRRMWKAYTKSSTSGTSTGSNEVKSEPKWSDADREYHPPPQKKPKKIPHTPTTPAVVTSSSLPAPTTTLSEKKKPKPQPSVARVPATKPSRSQTTAPLTAHARSLTTSAQPIMTQQQQQQQAVQSVHHVQSQPAHAPTLVVPNGVGEVTGETFTATLEQMHEMIQSQPAQQQLTADEMSNGLYPAAIHRNLEGNDSSRRPTFMLPPTDPLYDFMVATYMHFKARIGSKNGVEEMVGRMMAKDNGRIEFLDILNQLVELEKEKEINHVERALDQIKETVQSTESTSTLKEEPKKAPEKSPLCQFKIPKKSDKGPSPRASGKDCGHGKTSGRETTGRSRSSERAARRAGHGGSSGSCRTPARVEANCCAAQRPHTTGLEAGSAERDRRGETAREGSVRRQAGRASSRDPRRRPDERERRRSVRGVHSEHVRNVGPVCDELNGSRRSDNGRNSRVAGRNGSTKEEPPTAENRRRRTSRSPSRRDERAAERRDCTVRSNGSSSGQRGKGPRAESTRIRRCRTQQRGSPRGSGSGGGVVVVRSATTRPRR